MTALSKDKRWSFITLKFDSATVAEDVIDRFDGKYIYGHKVQISLWRVPKSLAYSGRFKENSYNLNSRGWNDNRSFDKETEKSTRHRNDFSRERNSWNAKHMSGDTACYDDKEDLSDNADDFRGYQGSTFNERYKEKSEEYSEEHWSSDGEGEGRYPTFDENWIGWDSDLSGGNEDLSERGHYEREEEFFCAHEEDVWQEREVDHEKDHDFVDQDYAKDYKNNFSEYDGYPEIYNGNPSKGCDDSPYAYSGRPFENTDEDSPYRSEELCTRNRQWHDDREYISNTQDVLVRNQDSNRSSFPSLDKGRQWPRWEAVAPKRLSRRRPSDPDIITNAPNDNSWEQNPRSCNKLGELTGRRAATLLEERPRSDEWLKNNHRHFRDRVRHSASPVNFRPKDYGHRGSPLMEKTLKSPSEISSKSTLTRKGRSSISPARDRHSSADRASNRSSSAERSSERKLHGTSPGSEISSHSFKERGLERRKRESRSYSPNPNTKVPRFRGKSNERLNACRRLPDLRRSLMLHQQRKHSSLRERSEEKGIKHSERDTKTSPDKPDKSPGSYSSAEFSYSTQGTNRKRHRCDVVKRRDEVEKTKRGRKMSLNDTDKASTYSDPENGNGDSTRNKRIIITRKSKKQPPLDQKRKTRQKRDHVTDNSSTKRADRLLSDLAVTLVAGNISLRRPGAQVDVSKNGTSKNVNSDTQKSVDGVRSHTIKPNGQSEGSRFSQKRQLEKEKPVATVTMNLQTLDTVEDVSCVIKKLENWSAVEGAPEGDITTPDNTTSNLAVPCCDGSSDQDMNEVVEFESNVDSSEEDLHHVKKSAQTDKVSPENHDFLDIKKNGTFVIDDVKEMDRVPAGHEIEKVVFIEKGVEEVISVQEDCHDDQHTTTNEPSEKLGSNSDDFALHQSHVKKNNICTDSDTCCDVMSTILQHVHMEISPPDVDVEQETCLRGNFVVCEDGKNELGPSSSSITVNSHEVKNNSSHNKFLLMKSRPEKMLKTSSKNPLQLAKGRDDRNGCLRKVQKSMQETSHNCDERDAKFSNAETSPGAIPSNKVFRYHVELNNVENAMVEEGKENYSMENASTDVTKAKPKASQLVDDGLRVNRTRPEMEFSETNVCSVEFNADALKRGGFNIKEPACESSEIPAACALEKVKVDATYIGKEQCVSKNKCLALPQEINGLDKEVYKVEHDVKPQNIDGSNDVMTNITCPVQESHELEDTVNYFKCQEKVTYTDEEDVYILEDAKVTQREVYDQRGGGSVCNSRSEGCSGDGGEFDGTEAEQVCFEGANDTQQKVYNQVGINEGNSNREDANKKDAVVSTIDLKQEHCDLKNIDVTFREESIRDVWNLKDEENNSENTGFDAFNAQKKVCDTVSKDATSCFNNAKQERHSSERKYNNIEHRAYNMADGCSTQQEVFCFNDGNRSDNARKENHTAVNGRVYERDTEQKSHHLYAKSYNRVNAQETQEKRSITNMIGHITNTTEDPRLKFSIQDDRLNGTTSKKNPVHIGTRDSCWKSLEHFHSIAAQAQYSPMTNIDLVKSSASALSNSHVNPQVKKSHHLVAEDFEQVDMEISSDEEHKDNFTGPSICVDTGITIGEKNGYIPYSPSSPTWRSDEQRSPLPKEDASLYSPSHPTNVSEGDAELSFTTGDVSYEGGKRECDTLMSGTTEVNYPDARKNKLASREADEEIKVLHVNQAINGSSNSGTAATSMFSSSLKSGAGLFQHVWLANDFIDANLSTKGLAQNRTVTTSKENRGTCVNDGEVCSDNSASGKSTKDSLRPLLRCQKRTQSLPASASTDAKPKVVYVTAAKTYDFYTDSGTQNKPRIFYATNDKTAGPARSLSLDTALGKSWPLGENSNNLPIHNDQESRFGFETVPTVEVEKRKQEKDPGSHVEPFFPDGSFINDAHLKPSKVTAQDGDQDAAKISSTSNTAKSDDVAVSPELEGPGNCSICGVTFSMSTVNKESVVPSSNTDENTSVPESESLLVIKVPSELRRKDVPTEQSLSTDHTLSQMTGNGSTWERSKVSNVSCGSGETAVTSDVTEKRHLASASERWGFGFSYQGTTLPKNSLQAGNAVSDLEGENENDGQRKCSSEIRQILPIETGKKLFNSIPRSASKRTHPYSAKEASHSYKVPRKPLKLIIPTNPLSNCGIKRTAQPANLGRYYKKTSTSTVTRANVDLVPAGDSSNVMQGDGSAIRELFSGDKDSMITEKDASSENVELMCTSSPAIILNGCESSSPSITDCFPRTSQTGNTSPLTARLSAYNHTTASAENSTMEHAQNGTPMDDKGSCSGKESDWIALKMEQLRKKKEEIEQVYKRECHTVVNVVKMLVSNDPRLEGLLQNSVRRSLQEMGRRCVQELEKQVRPGS